MNIDPDEIIRTNAKLGCFSWKAWTRLTFHQRGITLWYFSDIPDTLFNSVIDCEDRQSDFQATLNEICRVADRRKVPLAWMVNREIGESQPYREALTLAGFTLRGSTLGMLLELSSLSRMDDFFESGPFQIKPVCHRRELHLWASLVMQTYGFPKDRITYWAELHEKVGIDKDSPWRHHLVWQAKNPSPVAACSLFAGEPPYQSTFANLAVSLDLRGKGLGSAITKWCLNAAKEDGYSHSSLYASPEAVDLYRKLGFTSHHTNHLYYRSI